MTVGVFKHVERAICYNCDARWFGRDGDIAAQVHASETGHTVVVEVVTRTTFNGDVAGTIVPPPVAIPAPSPALPTATPRQPEVADPWPAPTRKLGGRLRYAGADRDEGSQLAKRWGHR